MKTFAVIPTRYESLSTLFTLLENLEHDQSVDKIYILDNITEDGDFRPIRETQKTQVLDLQGFSIYEMWNRAWEYIRYNYKKDKLNIAFLNDDIEIKHDTCRVLAMKLRQDDSLAAVYPDYNFPWDMALDVWETHYTESTFGHGGMSGFAFMIKGELDIPYIDENLKLFWGDDDLVKQIAAKGYKIGKIRGLAIQHLGSVTVRKMDAFERTKLMISDMKYFNSKYSENRTPPII